ncbi:MAG: hypothetical protein ACTHQE_13380, partial [Thermomicrobiales bacterium]
RARLGDDDDDEGALDYLPGAPAPAPVAAAPRPRPTPEPVVVVPTEEASSGGGKRAAGASLQPMTNPILDRAIGVARFAPRYYDAIAADPKATAEAALVVAVVAVAGGIGGLRHGVDGFLVGIVMAVVKWGLLAVAAYAILPRFAPGARREGGLAGGIAPLARTLGYAQGPRVLAIAGLIPLIGWSLSVVGTVWVVLASIVAIRQTAKVGFGEAAIVTVVGWVIATVAAVILAVLFGLGIGAAL